MAAWFFAPWLVLPEVTFSLIPVAILRWFVVQCRPAMWAWPLIALCAVYPRTLLYVWYANPTLWMAAFVGLAFRYHWPGALILLKPSLLPFALVGIRSRGWWLTVLVLGIGSLPFLAATLAYPAVVMGVEGGGLLYSLPGLPGHAHPDHRVGQSSGSTCGIVVVADAASEGAAWVIERPSELEGLSPVVRV